MSDRVRDGMSGDERPAPPRLLALRVQGFKSFAERTSVEFGGGISAVVGPNGSGKSNLADALRWALGEQGRALRSRKAEDVIWAGSERRSAQGMADVTLVLDNGDGLLPVDFQVLELGRRLYRSGENEYLLNKQRIRLRDLVDLLDGAHLADNAFLFIGQGMVDQALALRPEERRPLFEEVAGVRRHERRRRKAEEQLVESEANLARVDDILAELRPQARRLAAQAEQQATRSTVGEELAAAILATSHGRWHAMAARHAAASARQAGAAAESEAALVALEAAETTAAGLATGLAERAAVEQERRDAHEHARATLTRLQLHDGRIAADLEGIARDRLRSAEERAAAEAELGNHRRALAVAPPARDHELEGDLAGAERELAEALAEIAALRTASRARDADLAALRRAEAARTAELETARRRAADAQRRLDELRTATETVRQDHARQASVAQAAADALERATAAETSAAADREAARVALEAAEADRALAVQRAAAAAATSAAIDGRLAAVEDRLADDERRPIAAAARRVGGRRVDDDLVVDPVFRAAVETALAETARAYLVGSASVERLAGERGRLVVEERVAGGDGPSSPTADAMPEPLQAALAAAGGGRLADAIRRDGTGTIRRLLGRSLWAPDLATALAVQPSLPPGWTVVVRDGSARLDDTGVVLGAADGVLERQAEASKLRIERERASAALTRATADAATAEQVVEAARTAMATARATETERHGARRAAETDDRSAARAAEAAARELAWHVAQLDRLEAEASHRQAALATADEPETRPAVAGTPVDPSALATWEARATTLRERRDALATRLAAADAARHAAEAARARADAGLAMAEERIARADRDAATAAERETALAAERDRLAAEVAAATSAEAAARAALGELHAADAADRAQLADAERAASAARERLRGADDRRRAADHAELEARLGLDALRESVLVELAGLGELGLTSLGIAAPDRSTAVSTDADADAEPASDAPPADDAATIEVAVDVAALEGALTGIAARWATEPPPADVPSPTRLAQLRRRYHDLGAANPFAVDEYAELKARLEALETQGDDLRRAIEGTRALIGELDTMIADQFRATFTALETAFERRFEQLFDGGYARLSLTDPSDLGTTGIEIVARPPGKKPQALAMLSGGERALTAVALLFAMLEVRPVPFCVLDEVDAALDEANIGRFADALRSLAHQTQFIVITHNRGTIEAAEALYGVTVGDDSVSRVISLRLDEARAIASDRPTPLGATG